MGRRVFLPALRRVRILMQSKDTDSEHYCNCACPDHTFTEIAAGKCHCPCIAHPEPKTTCLPIKGERYRSKKGDITAEVVNVHETDFAVWVTYSKHFPDGTVARDGRRKAKNFVAMYPERLDG